MARRLISRKELFEAKDIAYADIDTPEWGEDTFVRVRGLTAGQRSQYEESLFVERERRNGAIQRVIASQGARVTLVILGVVNDAGEPMFTEADRTALEQKAAAPMERICDRILDLSGMKQTPEKLGKGSASGPSDGSGSDSRSSSAAPSQS